MIRVRPSAVDFAVPAVFADLAVVFLAADDDFLAVAVFVDLVAFFTADDGFLTVALDVFFFAASSLIGEAVSNTGEMLTTPIYNFSSMA